MREVTSKNFGLLIAYLLPGFTMVWGISHVSPEMQAWLGTTASEAPTVGGFLYVTLASVAAGLTVSTIRWAVVDTIHHRTGICKPRWDFSKLGEKVSAFEALIEIHYRYYQWYANMLIALPLAFILRWSALGFRWSEMFLLIVIEALFFFASRDTIRKYYQRVESLLAQ